MFDINDFKKKVKEWMRENPLGSEAELRDTCEELIPPTHFAANRWLIEQTLSWYKNILKSRETSQSQEDGDDDEEESA